MTAGVVKSREVVFRREQPLGVWRLRCMGAGAGRSARRRAAGGGRSRVSVQVTGRVLNGGTVPMHSGTDRRGDPAHARLPEIPDGLAARGYHLVTVCELLRDAPPIPAAARLTPHSR